MLIETKKPKGIREPIKEPKAKKAKAEKPSLQQRKKGKVPVLVGGMVAVIALISAGTAFGLNGKLSLIGHSKPKTQHLSTVLNSSIQNQASTSSTNAISNNDVVANNTTSSTKAKKSTNNAKSTKNTKKVIEKPVSTSKKVVSTSKPVTTRSTSTASRPSQNQNQSSGAIYTASETYYGPNGAISKKFSGSNKTHVQSEAQTWIKNEQIQTALTGIPSGYYQFAKPYLQNHPTDELHTQSLYVQNVQIQFLVDVSSKIALGYEYNGHYFATVSQLGSYVKSVNKSVNESTFDSTVTSESNAIVQAY